jgi:hypothetical protein
LELYKQISSKINKSTFGFIPLTMGGIPLVAQSEGLKIPYFNPLAFPIATIEKLNKVLEWILEIRSWFDHIGQHIFDFTIELFGWGYEFLAGFVMMTPTILFTGDWFTKSSILFGVIAVFLTMLFSVWEGIKKVIRGGVTNVTGFSLPFRVTDRKTILKKYPIALAVSGFAPFIFEKIFGFVNTLSLKIVDVGRVTLTQANMPIDKATIGFWDCVAMLGFDCVLLATMLPLVLKTFVRWFDIMCLGALTPLAMTAYVFDQHNSYYTSWWSAIKKCIYTQLTYVVFVTIMGLLVMGIHDNDLTWQGLFVKIGVVVGGLWRLANPPSFVKATFDNRDDIIDVYQKTRDRFNIKKTWKANTNDLGKGFESEQKAYKIMKGSRLYKKVDGSKPVQATKKMTSSVSKAIGGKIKSKVKSSILGKIYDKIKGNDDE